MKQAGNDGYTYQFFPETKTAIASSAKTGATVQSLGYSDGYQGDAVHYYKYTSPYIDFKFGINFDHGSRIVNALLPLEQAKAMSQTGEAWETPFKRQEALRKALNVIHYEVVSVDYAMPLSLPLAEDFMRLLWSLRSHGGAATHANITVGFLNKDPNASWRSKPPYLRVDQTGVFHVGGEWEIVS